MSGINVYDIGDKPKLTLSITLDGVAIDPTTLTLKVKDPDGVETPYVYGMDDELARDGVGSYHIILAPAIAGLWLYRWESTGTAAAAEEGAFKIRERSF